MCCIQVALDFLILLYVVLEVEKNAHSKSILSLFQVNNAVSITLWICIVNSFHLC
jgi:4-hydroxybenzoate polyprenyltransferase